MSYTPIKGRLKHAELEKDLPFTRHESRDDEQLIYGRIANVPSLNVFYVSEGWSFEADAPQLPTEPGFYRPQRDVDEGSKSLVIFILGNDGQWYGIGTGQTGIPPVAVDANHWGLRYGVVRI